MTRQCACRFVTDRCVPAQSVSTPATRSKTIAKNFRAVIENGRQSDPQHFDHDLENAVTFLRSQRMYKVRIRAPEHVVVPEAVSTMQVLLERYNPLHDMSTEERVKATARRVGLDMPVKENGDQDQ